MNRIALATLMAIAVGTLSIQLAAPRAQRTGYVDPTKALNATTEGKELTASLNAFSAEKRAQIAAALAEVKKAKDAKKADAEIAMLQAQADQIRTDGQAELERRQNAGAAKISEGLNRIIPKLRAAHGFAALAQTPLAVDPALDLTAELAAQYNAGAGDPSPPPETEAATAKKLADLEQKVRAFEAAKSMSGAAVVASNGKPTTTDHKGATQ